MSEQTTKIKKALGELLLKIFTGEYDPFVNKTPELIDRYLVLEELYQQKNRKIVADKFGGYTTETSGDIEFLRINSERLEKLVKRLFASIVLTHGPLYFLENANLETESIEKLSSEISNIHLELNNVSSNINYLFLKLATSNKKPRRAVRR